MHLPVEINEIQARYLDSSYFKDIYLYLVQNKLPTSKAAVRKVETLAETLSYLVHSKKKFISYRTIHLIRFTVV